MKSTGSQIAKVPFAVASHGGLGVGVDEWIDFALLRGYAERWAYARVFTASAGRWLGGVSQFSFSLCLMGSIAMGPKDWMALVFTWEKMMLYICLDPWGACCMIANGVLLNMFGGGMCICIDMKRSYSAQLVCSVVSGCSGHGAAVGH